MSKLTAKQELFIQEYLVDLNAKQAAIRAGYSENTAEQQGSRLLSNVKVAAAVEEAKAERLERTKFNADKILIHLSEITEADIGDILDEQDCFLPVKQWPKIWRQMLTGMDVRKEFEGRGDDREHVANTIKVKFLDRLKGIEMIGKHVDVQAWKEKVELDTPLVIVKDLAGGKLATSD
jgi:phage terminase small subunit